jgi:hypothetical protein
VAKKSKNDKEQKSEKSGINFSFFGNLLKPLRILLDIHLKLAIKELKKDGKRFLSGITSLLVGCFFIVSFYFLLNVLIIVLLNELLDIKEMKLFFCVLIDTGANLLLAIIFFTAGRLNLKKPLLEDTKKIIEETVNQMKNEN